MCLLGDAWPDKNQIINKVVQELDPNGTGYVSHEAMTSYLTNELTNEIKAAARLTV